MQQLFVIPYADELQLEQPEHDLANQLTVQPIFFLGQMVRSSDQNWFRADVIPTSSQAVWLMSAVWSNRPRIPFTVIVMIIDGVSNWVVSHAGASWSLDRVEWWSDSSKVHLQSTERDHHVWRSSSHEHPDMKSGNISNDQSSSLYWWIISDDASTYGPPLRVVCMPCRRRKFNDWTVSQWL